jgi:hypothetical protein
MKHTKGLREGKDIFRYFSTISETERQRNKDNESRQINTPTAGNFRVLCRWAGGFDVVVLIPTVNR